jgi:hypothetical protein
MVDKDAEAALRRGLELGHGPGQIVDAVQRLDHDSELAQVVAPDMFDQFCIVLALDPNPRGPSHLGPNWPVRDD